MPPFESPEIPQALTPPTIRHSLNNWKADNGLFASALKYDCVNDGENGTRDAVGYGA